MDYDNYEKDSANIISKMGFKVANDWNEYDFPNRPNADRLTESQMFGIAELVQSLIQKEKKIMSYTCHSCGEPISWDCNKCKKLWES